MADRVRITPVQSALVFLVPPVLFLFGRESLQFFIAFVVSLSGWFFFRWFPYKGVPFRYRICIFWIFQVYLAMVPSILMSRPDQDGSDLTKPDVMRKISSGSASGSVNSPIDAEAVKDHPPPILPPSNLRRANAEIANPEPVSIPMKTLSVVLPCAFEGDLMVKTVKSVYENSLPVLKEIVVVDDGSNPPLRDIFPDYKNYNVSWIRHDTTQGLIRAKKDGGDAATGDVIAFLDCHVKPDINWWKTVMSEISENWKRVVVPTITALDVDKWEEMGRPAKGQGMSKCYLTFDVEFKWFTSPDPYVPVMSGGLLAMSNKWWKMTGGYDMGMFGWGGENIDQSLRIWLCGGEIVSLPDSYVAHMWRENKHPKTQAKYRVPAGAPQKNRMRAVKAWFGQMFDKVTSYPEFMQYKTNADQQIGDISNIIDFNNRLNCKSMNFFIDRFAGVYHHGGLLPKTVFQIQSKQGLCIHREGGVWGNAVVTHGALKMRICDSTENNQMWHKSNRDGDVCCSGLRGWNSDQCIMAQGGTAVCDIDGNSASQYTNHQTIQEPGVKNTVRKQWQK